MADGFIGLFVINDDAKITPYINLLRGSIYEYLALEVFEDATHIGTGVGFRDPQSQSIIFTSIGQIFISTNLVEGGVVTTYNYDCIFYADFAGSPTFYISPDGTNWTLITNGAQFNNGGGTTTQWYVKIVSTTSSDKINSYGVVFGRKNKYRTQIMSQV